MKKSIFLFIILAGCSINKFTYKNKGKISNSKYNLYKKVTFNCVENHWGSYRGSLKNKKYKVENIQFDKMWFQGFYGIFLAFDYFRNKDIYTYVSTMYYLKSIKNMLGFTDGIYLRDNSPYALGAYIGGQENLEASKDQILGLVTSLLMIYYYVDDKPIRNKIKDIIENLDENLRKHGYMLYNENKKRFYKSAYYCLPHHYGISRAINFILNRCKRRSDNSIVKSFHRITFESLKFKRRLVNKEMFIGNINIFDIPQLRDKRWYREILQKDEFSVNLTFYELLIGATISCKEAKKVIKLLEHKEVRKLKHLNLAALYLYTIRKWKLKENCMSFYLRVLSRDDKFYPACIVPNNINWGIGLQDTVNGFIIKKSNLLFSFDWSMKVETDKTFDNLLNKSKNKKIEIDAGIPFLARFLLANY